MQASMYVFLPQCLLGLAHVHKLLLMKLSVMSLRLGRCGNGSDAKPSKQTPSLWKHPDHFLGLVASPPVSNLGISGWPALALSVTSCIVDTAFPLCL